MANAAPATSAPKTNTPPPPAPPASAQGPTQAAPLATTNGTPPPEGAALAAPVKVKKPIDKLRDLLDKAKPSMAAVLPKHMTPERLVKLALVACVRQPKLLECDVQTVLQSVMTAAQLGLDCSGVLGSAYLVPFKNNKKNRMECQLITGYRGLIDLARRSGEIETIEAHVIYREDFSEVEYGLNPKLVHKPCLTGDPGPLTMVYAVAKLKGGGTQVEVMTRAQVDGIKRRSKSSENGPWVTDYDEMARKTVVRRISKYLPLSVEVQTQLAREDAFEEERGFIDIDMVGAEEIQPEPGESKASAMAARLKGGSAPAEDVTDADVVDDDDTDGADAEPKE